VPRDPSELRRAVYLSYGKKIREDPFTEFYLKEGQKVERLWQTKKKIDES